MAKKRGSQQANIKKYRKLYAEAKRRGLVRGDKDARSLQPSSYMKTKLNKLAPYMTDDYTSVKVPPKLSRAFRGAETDLTPIVANNRILVKSDSNLIPQLRKGRLTRVRKLANGEHEEIIIPIRFDNLDELEDVVLNNPYLNEILRADEDELYAFKLFGNPSLGQFSELSDLVKYLYKYNNLDPDNDPDGENFASLQLFRSRNNWDWTEFRQQVRERNRRERADIRRGMRVRNKRPLTPAEQAARNERRKMLPGYQRQLERQRQQRQEMTPEQRAKKNEQARLRMKRMRERQKKEQG